MSLAYELDDYKVEIHNGVEVAMAPSPGVNHNIVVKNIVRFFDTYLKGKPCMVFTDGLDVKLSGKDKFIPDVMVVCKKDIIKHDGIYGAPDLVVEVLSPGTAKYDKGYKRKMYAFHGVREFWTIDPLNRTIETHILVDGHYDLMDIIFIPHYYSHYENEVEKCGIEVVTEFSPAIFPEMLIQVAEVFEGCLE